MRWLVPGFLLCQTLNAAAITSGVIQLRGMTGSFIFRGDGFEFTGSLSMVNALVFSCNGSPPFCPDNRLLPIGSSNGGEFGNGTAVLGGAFERLYWGNGSNFSVSGPSVQLAGPGDYTGPITMTARMCAFQGMMADCRFVVNLTGVGFVSFTAFRAPMTGELWVREASYVLTREAIPEPSTTALLVLGSALMVRCSRRL